MPAKSVSLDYYGLVRFKISGQTDTENELVRQIYADYLSPFFRHCSEADVAHYEIHLAKANLNASNDWSEWSAITFLDDPAVTDFRDGLTRRTATGREIYNPRNGTGFRIADNRIEIIYQDSDALVRDLMRVIKQLLITQVENAGGCVLHASAIAINGQAVCFVGRKGQGKTTSVLQALQLPGAKYITNDRLPLIWLNGEPHALGWFEELRIIHDRNAPKVKTRVNELMAEADIEQSPKPLRLILLPNNGSDSEPSQDAREILYSQLLTPADIQRPKWLGFADEPPFDPEPFLGAVKLQRFDWHYQQKHLLPAQIGALIDAL